MQLNAFTLRGFKPDTFRISEPEANAAVGPLTVEAPADVHTALLRNGLLEDPRCFANDRKAAWVERFTWVYGTVFSINPAPGARYRLICEGLDTYCTVLLNGKTAGSTENMLVPHEIDVTSLVQKGENRLLFVFDPMPERASRPLPEGFWTNYSTERAWARKAAFGYGWDWCARLATVGVWRPVRLEELEAPALRDVFFATESIGSAAQIACSARLDAPAGFGGEDLNAVFSLGDGEREFTASASFENGLFTALLTVGEPKLWWTWDLGAPFLYAAKASLYLGNRLVCQKEFSFGIRTVSLRLRDGESGEERFQFLLNGVPVYGKGANWVPVDNLLTLPDRAERYETLLCLAREANMNMLNLWGGGIYEDELFYDRCDSMGILVLQYFMFACGEVPDYDEGFTADVRAEVEKAVIRLRNRACVALWIGNVENEMLCQKIGLTRAMYGKRLFEEDIPAWLKKLDPTRMYRSSSPTGGTDANSADSGDRHNWDVWFKDIPYTDYRRDGCLFASEFGVHASPAAETVARWLPEGEREPGSFGWSYFNKDAEGPAHMDALFRIHTGMPRNADEAVRYSMLIQADALRCAAEHYRHGMPHNGGALLWQLNDSWPCHSWSIVDYDGVPKAAWYAARKFFAPVSLLLYPSGGDETEICVSNTTRSTFSGTVLVTVRDVMGTCVFSETLKAEVPAYTCSRLKTLRAGGRFSPNVILPNRKRWYYISASIPKIPRSETFRYFCEYRDAALPACALDLTCEKTEDALRVTLQSSRHARMVSLEGDMRGLSLSDNYFDMNANTPYTVTVRALHGAAPEARRLFVRALNSPGQSIRSGNSAPVALF